MRSSYPGVGEVVKNWKEVLNPDEFYVLREAGTEPAYTGEFWNSTAEGIYSCRGCGTEIFRSTEKMDAHCGWPSFFAPKDNANIRYLQDNTFGMNRIEVRCAHCDSHLGHVFEGEGFDTPTDLRYCLNSLSLTFNEQEVTP